MIGMPHRAVLAQSQDPLSARPHGTNFSALLSQSHDPGDDSTTTKLDYLHLVTRDLDRDNIDAPNAHKTEDVLRAINIAQALTELELPFKEMKILVNFIVALELWATDPSREALARNEILSEYLHQYELDVGGNPDE